MWGRAIPFRTTRSLHSTKNHLLPISFNLYSIRANGFSTDWKLKNILESPNEKQTKVIYQNSLSKKVEKIVLPPLESNVENKVEDNKKIEENEKAIGNEISSIKIKPKSKFLELALRNPVGDTALESHYFDEEELDEFGVEELNELEGANEEHDDEPREMYIEDLKAIDFHPTKIYFS